MGTIHVNVTDRNGREHNLLADEGITLMDLLKAKGLPVAAICGGARSCATCHVYVTDGYARLDAPEEEETDLLLESDHYREGISRLSCQITVAASLNAMKLELAPRD